ncbi:MFS transporter [Actinocorallia sp. A-T 12471]|uniref:MFS transporter n=1 Tax=Actinocorallia sp. A-T 12471 TaxID=3089813 RepID=UPI0029CD9F45|nr:MFS transporter [Actinocorallia sp. A-T 12471]MDX6744061.1 MFS transporter [Actinocorallia sp. A-T 12471]
MTAAPPRGVTGGRDTTVRAVVGILVMFEITSGFLQGGLTPLLPALGEHHGVADSDLNWVLSLQLLAAAVCVPTFGRLGDLYGHRRLLRIALVMLAAGTLLVALAPNLQALLVGRVLQGPLAALLPLEVALVKDRLPEDKARQAIARLVGSLTFGGLLGAVIMGAVHEAVGNVRVALLLPALLAVGCVPISFLRVPESVPRATGRADWPGLLLLGFAMIAILSGVSRAEASGWISPGALGPLALGLALLAGWTRVELRSADPLVDLRAMADRRIAPFFAVAFLFGIVFFGVQTPDTTFLAADPETDGYGFGLSALSLSLMALPATVLAVAGSAFTARIARGTGYRAALVLSFGLVSGGILFQALLHAELWQLVVAKMFMGFGAGLALGALPTVIVEAADPGRTGVLTALYNNVKTLGGAVAGGVIASVLATMALEGTPTEAAYVVVWLLCAACAAVAGAAVLFARRTETARVR